MRLVSTTGPKVTFILFLHFSRTQLLACSLEKYLHLVLTPRSTTIQLTHGCMNDNFGMLNRILRWSSSLIKLKFFSSFQMNNPNNQDNLPQIQHFLSPTKEIPQIFTIFEPFSTFLISFLVETSQIPRIFGIGHQHYSNFSNNTGYTLQLQASTQLTMLRMVLDHNSHCFYDSLAQLQAQTDSQYPLLLILSIVTLRGVCNHKISNTTFSSLVHNLTGTVFLL